MNLAVVRPLVDKFFELDDVSISMLDVFLFDESFLSSINFILEGLV